MCKRNVGSNPSQDVNSSEDFLLILVTVAAVIEHFNMTSVSANHNHNYYQMMMYSIDSEKASFAG